MCAKIFLNHFKGSIRATAETKLLSVVKANKVELGFRLFSETAVNSQFSNKDHCLN